VPETASPGGAAIPPQPRISRRLTRTIRYSASESGERIVVSRLLDKTFDLAVHLVLYGALAGHVLYLAAEYPF